MHKSVIGLIGIGVVIILMSVIMSGLKSSATDSRQDHSVSPRQGGQTTAIVGTQELPWKALTSSVQTITSNYASDYPLCEQVSGNEITIEGLAPSETRVVTITYLYDANQGFMGQLDADYRSLAAVGGHYRRDYRYFCGHLPKPARLINSNVKGVANGGCHERCQSLRKNPISRQRRRWC